MSTTSRRKNTPHNWGVAVSIWTSITGHIFATAVAYAECQCVDLLAVAGYQYDRRRAPVLVEMVTSGEQVHHWRPWFSHGRAVQK